MSTPTSDDRSYCSLQQDQGSMLGTAEQVDVWLMLEAPGSWPARAVEEGAVATEVAQWLERSAQKLSAQGLRVRPQLIKQPGRKLGEAGAQRTLLIGYAERLFQIVMQNDAQLLGLDVGEIVEDVRANREVQATRVNESHYFVCTNGRRDLCCARFGLPVYRQLQEQIGSRAWQVNHVGGHRFAPNVLSLPQGVLYGRVQPEDVDAFLQQVESGALAFAWLRGRAAYAPQVQAAEGLLAQQQLKLLHVSATDAVTRVEFVGPEQRVAISVARSEQAEMILAGCNKRETKAFYPFLRRP
ncbi:MAG: sucrase ferredoxin [Pseudomonadales bacterium]